MRRFVVVILTLTLIGCVATQQKSDSKLNQNPKQSIPKNDTLKIKNDSLSYEVIIIEPGFNAWLVTQPQRGYYSQSFLEIKNRFFVISYNTRVLNPQVYDHQLYTLQIDYNYKTDYGYEVNYLLYNYFIFFQQKYNQQLF